jgi:hypothetical protein
MLADLREERDRLGTATAMVDRAIAALEPLELGAAPASTNGTTRPAAKAAVQRKETSVPREAIRTRVRRTSKLDEGLVAKARALWDKGKTYGQIAEQLEITYSRVYGWKQAYGWPAPGTNAETPAAKPAAEGTPGPRRRCSNEDCAKVTTMDPCSHCGAAWNRTR